MIIKITELTEIFCMLMYALFLVLSGMFLAGVFATFLFEVLPDKLQEWYKHYLRNFSQGYGILVKSF